MSGRGERELYVIHLVASDRRARDIYACPVRPERKSFTPRGRACMLMPHAAWWTSDGFSRAGFVQSMGRERVRS